MQSDLGAIPVRRLASLPDVMLWAWERPEDLTFLRARTTGVAFLAGTLYLRGDEVQVRPRLQPLRVPVGTPLVAVVRVEVDRALLATLAASQRTRALDEIRRLAEAMKPQGVQIDFDATVSQRGFYRQLLFELRRELPPDTALSITALASWCIGDSWVSDLPADEAVPMLFRMGVDERAVHEHLLGGRDFRVPICQKSLGVSTDEPLERLPQGRRVYIFHPGRWTPETVEQARTMTGRRP